MSKKFETADDALRAMPLPWRRPCEGCAHLREHDETYVRCGFPMPPMPGWVRVESPGFWGTFTRKTVFGPFEDGAIKDVCLVREAA